MTIVYQHENEVFACDADVPPIPLGNVPTLFSTAVDLRDLETGRTSNISADAVEGRFSLLLFVPPPHLTLLATGLFLGYACRSCLF